jgi:hypothetical protein
MIGVTTEQAFQLGDVLSPGIWPRRPTMTGISPTTSATGALGLEPRIPPMVVPS